MTRYEKDRNPKDERVKEIAKFLGVNLYRRQYDALNLLSNREHYARMVSLKK